VSGPKTPGSLDVAIGANIRAERERARVSQDYLAGLLGISHQQVQKYEAGATRVSAARLVEIGRALAVQPGHLLKGTGDVR
jgi:transcriptional regulator with XRE-family HTH domain